VLVAHRKKVAKEGDQSSVQTDRVNGDEVCGQCASDKNARSIALHYAAAAQRRDIGGAHDFLLPQGVHDTV
jgi:hypothetical protein